MNHELFYKDALRVSLTVLPNELDDDLNLVLNTLQSKKLISKPTRQRFQKKYTTEYENNTALMQWLITQPYTTYQIFKEALKDSDQLGCLKALEKGEMKAYEEKELKLYHNVEPTDGILKDFKLVRDKLVKMKIVDEDVYRCNPAGKNKGLALIINNVDFVQLGTRTGSDVDRDNMKSLLEQLGYVVTTCDNLKKPAIQAELKKFKDLQGHEDADSVVVVILSHGMLGGFFGTDDQLVELADVKSSFNFKNCPALKEKPKLFFMQACRTKPENLDIASDSIMQSDSAFVLKTEKLLSEQSPKLADNQESDGSKDIHIDADYLIAYSSTPGYVSWRHQLKGSWFIQALCQVIAENAEKEHISDMLVKVNNRIADAFGHHQTKQISEQTQRLRKKFYFHQIQEEANN